VEAATEWGVEETDLLNDEGFKLLALDAPELLLDLAAD